MADPVEHDLGDGTLSLVAFARRFIINGLAEAQFSPSRSIGIGAEDQRVRLPLLEAGLGRRQLRELLRDRGSLRQKRRIVLFIVLMVLGVFSFQTMSITRFPNIDLPLVSVTVTQADN